MSTYRFGDFALDGDTRQVLRGGEAVHLSPKAFLLLQTLLQAAPRAVSKADLQDRLWPDTFVVEANLHHLIVEIRLALGEDPRRPRFVRTVHRFGYAFQEPPASNERQAGRGAICRLRWDGGRCTLTAGEHVIGRDPSSDVFVDSTTVSRHHARLRVTADAVTLEDLSSKNGSFVRNRRIAGARRLADGDDIRIGMVFMTVRIAAEIPSTDTAVLVSAS
jgi:DNA-binding winged helix-turn-helix (wHTH) protein